MDRKIGNFRTRRFFAVAVLFAVSCASGCKNFFTPINNGGGTTTPVVNTGDYAYVLSSNTANATNPIYTLSGFTVGTGTLTALSGFPVTLPFAPTAAVVTPANTFLYVSGSALGQPVIYGYTIASTGALTTILSSTNSAALVNADVVSMDVSPDGQWLIALDANNSLPTIDLYQISSTGQLTVEPISQYPLTGGAIIVPNTVRIAPTGNYVAASLGTGGDVLFGFDTSTGALTALTQANTGSTSAADQAIVFDAAGATLYIARSGTGGGIYPYGVGTAGLNSSPVTGAPFAGGSGPASMVIDATGNYLYVGNRTDSTISAYTIGAGAVLKQISGSSFTSGSGVNALARDNSGKYILATAPGGAPDVGLYSFDATVPGKLDLATQASTGDPTEPAGALAIAMTH